MPISAEEALLNTTTLQLDEKETKWLKLLCEYTDIKIKNNFDGGGVEIGFEDMFYDNKNYSHFPIC